MTRPMPGPPERTSHDRHSAAGFIRSDCPWCASFRADESKRLTDAECAAEYWRARADFWANESLCLGGWFGWADGAEEVEDPPLYDVDRWYDVTHRFATHPHALEEA